jgi:CcmD family protein
MKPSIVGLSVFLLLVSLGRPVLAQTQPPGGPPPQLEGFVPVDTLPATEQVPAARYLITAYAFVWVAVFGYVWSLWKRLGRVEGELQQLAKRTKANAR